jgi:hypothetical protein
MFEKRKAAKLEAEKDREAVIAAAEEQRRVIESIRERAAQLPDENGIIAPRAFQEFVAFVDAKNVRFGTIPDVLTDVMVGLARGGAFVQQNTTLLLKTDETALLEVAVELLNEVTDRQFQGGSQGVSVPLGHGVRYRTGAVRGHAVTIGTHWATADTGLLTVTDQRIVYHGGRKTLEFLFTRLASLHVYSDAIDLGVTNRQSTSSFRTGNPELIAGIIHGAFGHQGSAEIIPTS